ncbi:hypothetical protein M9H77_12256 [Catharanthus roseus]|uniref:Uncharacterized protein n=1 Tax=Catharanthus roseus TaxID=4058 RepID=A0ACC0BH21_CATRO|nr:hypothetical protein M9H77_12256 [Catharanthus roseus]
MDSRYASLVIISQVTDLDVSKLPAFSNKAINNFSKGAKSSSCSKGIALMIISISIIVARLGANGHHSWIRCFGRRIRFRNYQSQSLSGALNELPTVAVIWDIKSDEWFLRSNTFLRAKFLKVNVIRRSIPITLVNVAGSEGKGKGDVLAKVTTILIYHILGFTRRNIFGEVFSSRKEDKVEKRDNIILTSRRCELV